MSEPAVEDVIKLATEWLQRANALITPEEMRQQAIADGLISISVDEKVPADAKFPEDNQGSNERPGMLGKPVNPSQGGYGEIRSILEDKNELNDEDEVAKLLDELDLFGDNIENEEKLIWQHSNEDVVDLEKIQL